MSNKLFEKELQSEADRILNASDARGLTLRLIGAIAVRLHSESAKKELARDLTDLDFIGLGKERKEIENLFKELGYIADWSFNTLHPLRLRFKRKFEERYINVDIWLDAFEMCHRFDFTKRLHLDKPTLPVTDLLMTKLQIVQLTEKDLKDVFSLLLDHELCENNNNIECINVKYLQEICSKNWGIYKTFISNIAKIASMLENFSLRKEQKELLKLRLTQLEEGIEKAPKSISWRLRAIIGEKIRWYNMPENIRGQNLE